MKQQILNFFRHFLRSAKQTSSLCTCLSKTFLFLIAIQAVWVVAVNAQNPATNVDIQNSNINISASEDIRLSTGTSGKAYYNNNEIATMRETGRNATVIVAAADASEKSKAGADFVCTGTNDQIRIIEAFNSLPGYGGSIYLTEGNYFISEPAICLNKNVKLMGSGASTVLHRKFDSGSQPFAPLISFDARNVVCIQDLSFNQNRGEYTSQNNIAVLMSGEEVYGRLSVFNVEFSNSSGPCVYTVNAHLLASQVSVTGSQMGIRFVSGYGHVAIINGCFFSLGRSSVSVKMEGATYAANITGNYFNRSMLDIEGQFHTISGNLTGKLTLKGGYHIITSNNMEGFVDNSIESLIDANKIF